MTTITSSLEPSFFGSLPGAGKHVDFFQLDDLLSEEERSTRDRVRHFCNQEIIPVIADYWERAEFPFEIMRKLATLGISGSTIRGYGCAGLSHVGFGLMAAEIGRADGGISVAFGVHNLAMVSIGLYGSKEQKERWLPAMARLEKIGAFGATEPDHGSDIIALETHAHRDGDNWVLNGAKRWIGNASFADVVVIWARLPSGRVSAFLVEKGMPGFVANVIEGKMALRTAWQTCITLENVRVPLANHLSNIDGFNDFSSVISTSRYGLSWGALGHATACYECALAYTQERKQFGKPLAQFQLVQQKLASMLAELTNLQLLCWRLGRLIESGKATTGMISLVKMQTTQKARRIVADARDLLGANGILITNHVGRHMVDLEVSFTAEGTDHIHSLMVGREITGVQAIL